MPSPLEGSPLSGTGSNPTQPQHLETPNIKLHHCQEGSYYSRQGYPNLMAQEFLYVYHINCHPRNLCGFQAQVPGKWITMLELRHSSVEDYTQKFFISGSNWEFPEKELAQQEFPIQACWGLFLSSQCLEIILTPEEEA